VRAIVRYSPLVRAGRVLCCRVLEYGNTGVLEYWSTGVGERAVGFSPQPNGSEVGCALGWRVQDGAPVRASVLWFPLVRGAPLLRCRVLAYWSTGVLQYVGCALGSGSGPAPQCASSCQFPRVPGGKWQHVKISRDDTFHPRADRGS